MSAIVTERRTLGSTGLGIAPVGIGGAGLCACPTDAVASEVTAAFLKGGVNFVDTGPAYGGGESERRLGVALADYPRDAYVIQTKVGDEGAQNGGHSPFSRAGVLASVRHSLETLKTPYVDIALLHDPYVDEVDAFLGKGGGMEAVRELMGQGVVKHFGCGAREHGPHLRLLEACPGEFRVSQTVDDENPLRHFLDQLELRDTLKAANVGLVNAAPLYRGLLVDMPTTYHSVAAEASRPKSRHAAVLGQHAASHTELAAVASATADWAASRGTSLLHVAVQWPLRFDDIACSPYGCSTLAQVDGLLQAATTPLPEGTFTALEADLGEQVANLTPEKHFYWFKKQRAGNKEWPEMAVYPRATWAHALQASSL